MHVVIGEGVTRDMEEPCVLHQWMPFAMHHGKCGLKDKRQAAVIHRFAHDRWRELVFLPDNFADRVGEIRGIDAVHHHGANGDHAVAAGAVRFEVHRAGHAGFLRTSGTSDPVRCVRVVFSEHGTARQHGQRCQDCDRSFHARFGKCHTGKAHQV